MAAVSQYLVRIPDRNVGMPLLNGKNSVLVTASGPLDARPIGAAALGIDLAAQIADLEVTEATYALSYVSSGQINLSINAVEFTQTVLDGDDIENVLADLGASVAAEYPSIDIDTAALTITVLAAENMGDSPWTCSIDLNLANGTTYTLVEGAPTISNTTLKADQDVVVSFPRNLEWPRASTVNLSS